MSLDRVLPAFLYVFLFTVSVQEKTFYVCGLLLLFLWFLKYRDFSFIILAILFVMCVFLLNNNGTIIYEGKVDGLTTNSIILKKGNSKVLVSNCSLRQFDSVVKVEGSAKPIQSAPQTYGSSISDWARQNGISHSIYAKSCTFIKQEYTIRHFVEKLIISRVKNIQFGYKVFFNVASKDDSFSEILSTIGYPFIGFIYLLKKILSYFLTDKKVYLIEGFIIIFNLFVMGFSFVAIRILISFCCRFLPIDAKSKTGIFGFCCMLLYPNKILSLSFMIPFFLRLNNVVYCHKTITRWFILSIIQSFYFSKVQLLTIFFYPVVVLIQGLSYFAILSEVIFPVFNSTSILLYLSNVFSLLNQFPIIGNWYGYGLILYCLFLLIIPKFKIQCAFILLLVFLKLQLFHPFNEVVFIQIGQGDAILINNVVDNKTILIDTGMESNYTSLKTMLYAKGISKIDYLIITHRDSDHAGNLNTLKQDFMVQQIVIEPLLIQSNTMILEPLNNKKYDNENDNSLVYLLHMNQTKLLLMADASKQVERELFRFAKNLDVDILKVGHHGSKTSTSFDLLSKTRVSYAVISSGLNNRYKHPNDEVIDLLNRFQINWFDTKDQGDIFVVFTRFYNFIVTTSRKIGIIRRW